MHNQNLKVHTAKLVLAMKTSRQLLTLVDLNIIGVGAAPISTNVSSQGSVMGVVTIGYMAPITKDFLLGIGAEYNPFNSQSGNYNYGVSNVRVNGTYQSQNQYNIFLSPATPVGTDGLLYGKVGYTGASVKATEGGVSNTQNLTGYHLDLDISKSFKVVYMASVK